MTKVPKLDNAVRVISNWPDLDGELQAVENEMHQQQESKQQKQTTTTTTTPPKVLRDNDLI